MIHVLFWADKLILLVQYLVNYYGAKTYQNLHGVKPLWLLPYYPMVCISSLAKAIFHHVQFLTTHQTTAERVPWFTTVFLIRKKKAMLLLKELQHNVSSNFVHLGEELI